MFIPKVALVIVGLLGISSCAKKAIRAEYYFEEREIVGTWVGRTKEGESYVFIFRKNIVDICTIENKNINRQFTMLWNVDDGLFRIGFPRESGTTEQYLPAVQGTLNRDELILNVPIAGRVSALYKVSSVAFDLELTSDQFQMIKIKSSEIGNE